MSGFGERLKTIRREKGLSVADFAAGVGMTQDGVLKLESGVRGKTLEKLPAFAKMLGCRIDDLFPAMDAHSPGRTDSAVAFDDDSLDDLEI